MTCDAGQVCIQVAFQGGSCFSCHSLPHMSGMEQHLASGNCDGFAHSNFFLGH